MESEEEKRKKAAEEYAVKLGKKLTDNPAMFVKLVRIINVVAYIAGVLCAPFLALKDHLRRSKKS